MQNSQWIALKVRTGYENNIAKALVKFADMAGFKGKIENVKSAVKKIAVFSNKKVKYEPVLPGYIIVKCKFDDDMWHFLRTCPGVFGVIGRIHDEESVTLIENESYDEAEVQMPEPNVVEKLKKVFKEIIIKKRNKKPVMRLPLNFLTSLTDKITGSITGLGERKLVQELIKSVKLAI